MAKNRLSHLTRAIRQKEALPPPDSREVRLLQWVTRRKIRGNGESEYECQGRMIKYYRHAKDELAEEIANGRFSEMAKVTGFIALKALVRTFDPQEHGSNFWSWALPYLRATIEETVENGRICLAYEAPFGILEEIKKRRDASEV